jgi:uncharacterized membrane protein
MLDLLHAIADFFLTVLKGITNFLEEFIPLLGKTVFLISPFILFTFTAYIVGGVILLVVAISILLILIFGGVAWARKKEIRGSELTGGIIFCVVIIDVLMVAVSASMIIASRRVDRDSVKSSNNQISIKIDDNNGPQHVERAAIVNSHPIKQTPTISKPPNVYLKGNRIRSAVSCSRISQWRHSMFCDDAHRYKNFRLNRRSRQ